MLHLILGILKIIGILLLVLLGLLVLLLLALAFVPVRYELAGKKKEGAVAARGKVTWLLRLASATAGYRDGRLQVRLKVLCFTLFKFGTGVEKERRNRSGRKQKIEPESGPESIPEREPENETAAEPGDEPENETAAEPGHEPESEAAAEPQAPEMERRETQESGPEGEPEPSKKMLSGLAGALQRLWQQIWRAGGFLLSLPERLAELLCLVQDIIWAADGRLEGLSQRMEGLRQKIKPYTTPESVALYKRMLWRLKYLWRHFGPRKMSGWIHFGTGAPDLTGQLTGLIYLILPASAEGFEVRPDFTDSVLEADVVMKGHIRACHLLRTAFGLWRDKELRKMIRRIKGGN